MNIQETKNKLNICERYGITSMQLIEMQKDLNRGFPNIVPLIDPSGEYIRQFNINIGVELWSKTVAHFFGK